MRIYSLLAGMIVCGGASGSAADAPAERLLPLLPAETLAVISVADMPRALDRWQQAGFQAPLANPTLRGLVERVEEWLPSGWKKPSGFPWREWLSLPAGEACLALLEAKDGKPVLVLGANVRGRHDLAKQFLKRWEGNMPAARQGETAGPPDKAQIPTDGTMDYFIKDDWLIAATERAITAELLRSWPGSGGLVNSPAYRFVMSRCSAGAELAGSDVRCFIRPIELLAARAGWQRTSRPAGREQFLQETRESGFDAIKAVGGIVSLATGRYAALYRAAIHAPDHSTTAMRVLLFPNGPLAAPPRWVPAGLAGVGQFSWEMQEASGPFLRLFDVEFARAFCPGEKGVFFDFLQGVKRDPNGPRIDFLAEFVRRMGRRVLVLCGSEPPGRSIWDRTLLAFEITDEPAFARALERWCKMYEPLKTTAKPAAAPVVIEGRAPSPELVDDEETAEVVRHTIAGRTAFEINSSRREGKKGKDVGIWKPPSFPDPTRSIWLTVAHGHLLWGNNGELLKFVLLGDKPLEDEPRFARTWRELQSLAGGPVSFWSFSRSGEDFRLLARCANPQNLWTPLFLEAGLPPKAAPAPPKSSPEASRTSKTPGPAGWFARTSLDGWMMAGFVLNDSGQSAERR